MPEHKIRVIAPRVGGGFGIKSSVFQDEVSAVILSIKLGRPVKWYEDRKEHLMIAGHERQQVHYIECAVRKDGMLLGVRDKIIVDFGVHGTFWTEVQPAMLTCASIPGPYKLKNYDFDLLCVVTNKGPCGPHRGFGRPVAAFVMERMMDIIAKRLEMSPEEIRLRNMIEVKDMPWTTPVGVVYDTGNYKEVLERTLELAELRKAPRRTKTTSRYGQIHWNRPCNVRGIHGSGVIQTPDHLGMGCGRMGILSPLRRSFRQGHGVPRNGRTGAGSRDSIRTGDFRCTWGELRRHHCKGRRHSGVALRIRTGRAEAPSPLEAPASRPQGSSRTRRC